MSACPLRAAPQVKLSVVLLVAFPIFTPCSLDVEPIPRRPSPPPTVVTPRARPAQWYTMEGVSERHGAEGSMSPRTIFQPRFSQDRCPSKRSLATSTCMWIEMFSHHHHFQATIKQLWIVSTPNKKGLRASNAVHRFPSPSHPSQSQLPRPRMDYSVSAVLLHGLQRISMHRGRSYPPLPRPLECLQLPV